MVSARIWGMGSLCHNFVTTFGRSSVKRQAVTVACGGREARSCHRPLLWAELLFHGAFPGWASLRRAFLMHSDAKLGCLTSLRTWVSVVPWSTDCSREMIQFLLWNMKDGCLVQFSHSVMSNSLRPHEPQHARPPCPSPTPRVHPNPCSLCW